MIRVRPAVPADEEALAALFLAARRRAFFWCDPARFRKDDYSTQTEGEIVHVAVDAADQPLGFIAIWRPDRFIHHLYVLPERQGQGIGSLLLASLDEWLPRPHRLKCLTRNEAALGFYQSHGWRVVDHGEDQMGDYEVMENGPSPEGWDLF